jgi:ribonuclease P protein component
MISSPFKFPKQEHLCRKAPITDLFEKGESLISYPIRVVWNVIPSVEDCPVKVVMSVSKKKFKHAVDRNKTKRLLRESYRLNKVSLQQLALARGYSVHIAFIWLSTELTPFNRVEKKMIGALSKIEIYISSKESTNINV